MFRKTVMIGSLAAGLIAGTAAFAGEQNTAASPAPAPAATTGEAKTVVVPSKQQQTPVPSRGHGCGHSAAATS